MNGYGRQTNIRGRGGHTVRRRRLGSSAHPARCTTRSECTIALDEKTGARCLTQPDRRMIGTEQMLDAYRRSELPLVLTANGRRQRHFARNEDAVPAPAWQGPGPYEIVINSNPMHRYIMGRKTRPRCRRLVIAHRCIRATKTTSSRNITSSKQMGRMPTASWGLPGVRPRYIAHCERARRGAGGAPAGCRATR